MNTLIALGAPIAVLLAYLATRPMSPAREVARRAHRVTRHPALANLGDVRARLDAELPGHQVDFVLARTARHGVDARTLWTWLDRFGAESLVVVLAAGHGYAGLLRALRDETTYDLDEARLLAGLSEPELFQLAA
ncbi:hypothetical protein ASC77_17915 [Nocardioides sp. Root1257]|uniref:hypothetical protein n=1 Tax=unclassified Nocardioides TaxID=2615069 RepID=UPI0006F32F78|nr:MULTISPECIES: hypothetical protein [unclassified Nocardioides]KQW47061.1 hypothetical protein ASC77_17915 [Nocardioides sp. Root1257]KRC43806.1 hypothetical protein ASE24_18870 [Nocardioides sp. Root224]